MILGFLSPTSLLFLGEGYACVCLNQNRPMSDLLPLRNGTHMSPQISQNAITGPTCRRVKRADLQVAENVKIWIARYDRSRKLGVFLVELHLQIPAFNWMGMA